MRLLQQHQVGVPVLFVAVNRHARAFSLSGFPAAGAVAVHLAQA